MLTRFDWLRGPEHHEGRRLGQTGPYLGELFMPPGRYRISASWNSEQRGSVDITINKGDEVIDVRLALSRRR